MQSIDGTSVKSSAAPKKRSGSPPKIIRDTMMDDELEPDAKEREGVDVDSDALAYIRARKNVMTLAAAKKLERAWWLFDHLKNLNETKVMNGLTQIYFNIVVHQQLIQLLLTTYSLEFTPKFPRSLKDKTRLRT